MDPTHKDNSFREFRRVCANVAEESSYIGKTNIVATFLKKGTSKGLSEITIDIDFMKEIYCIWYIIESFIY